MIKYCIIGLLIIAVIISWSLAVKYIPYDDTDLAFEKRSGLKLYTDYGTGCQYLATPYGKTLTPRFDREGKHICICIEN